MKLSPVQRETLKRLAASGEPLVYFKGGYWTLPSLWNNTQPFWHVTTCTMRMLVKHGLLETLEDSSNYSRDFCPALADRGITEAGRAEAQKE